MRLVSLPSGIIIEGEGEKEPRYNEMMFHRPGTSKILSPSKTLHDWVLYDAPSI